MSPRREAKRPSLLDVQIIRVEEISVRGAADVNAGVVRPRPEDEEAEETDGESTLQVAAVRDTARVQQLVSMEISEGFSFLRAAQVFLKEPDDRLDLKRTENEKHTSAEGSINTRRHKTEGSHSLLCFTFIICSVSTPSHIPTILYTFFTSSKLAVQKRLVYSAGSLLR